MPRRWLEGLVVPSSQPLGKYARQIRQSARPPRLQRKSPRTEDRARDSAENRCLFRLQLINAGIRTGSWFEMCS